MKDVSFLSRVAPIALTALVTVAGCSTSAPHQTQLMKKTDLTVSSAQLQVQVRSLADRFSGLMEEAGEEALEQTEDPAMRRRVLLWLTNGIPAMQHALFRPDPLAALLDGWFLVAQMHFYFEEYASENLPQHFAEIAMPMLDTMEADIKDIVIRAGSEASYETGRQLVYDAAGRYPLNSSFASRKGSSIVLSEFTARASSGALKSIGSLTETMDDLIARFDLNSEYLPKQVRWQAQLMMIDEGLGSISPSLEHLAYLEVVAGQVDRLTPLVEALPDLVAEERVAVLEALDTELSRILRFIDQQRTILMHEDVRSEREAVLIAISEERIAVLEAIADERRIVLDALREERMATFQDLDDLMDKAFTREINKLFIRGLILIAILLGGFAAITFLGVRALNKRNEK
jgi:hypothetical protein